MLRTFRRSTWFIVLVVSFVLMLVQTRNRLLYYLGMNISFLVVIKYCILFSMLSSRKDNPVSTTVSYVRNNSLMFPSLTLCPYRQGLWVFLFVVSRALECHSVVSCISFTELTSITTWIQENWSKCTRNTSRPIRSSTRPPQCISWQIFTTSELCGSKPLGIWARKLTP